MDPSVLGCQRMLVAALAPVSIVPPTGPTRILATVPSWFGRTLGFVAQFLSPKMDIGPLPVRDDSLGVWPALG